MTLYELNKHLDTRKRLAEVKALHNALLAASYPGGQAFDGMPRAPTVKDKVCDLAVEIADLNKKIAIIEAEVKQEEPEISMFISGIKDDQTRVILNLRFIRCLEWKDIAKVIGGKNTEGSVKHICYRYLKSCNAMSRRVT